MENSDVQNSQDTKTLGVFIWILIVVFVGGISFFLGKASNNSSKQDSQQVAVISPTTSPIPTQLLLSPTQITPAPTIDLESICEKSGPSQKKDYLVSYLLKEGDSFKKIAEEQLHDGTRVSELTTLNSDQKQLTVGSTIYLPPVFIKQSTGNIFETSGKIVKKDNASWQISYGGGEKGPGLWIPGFMFKDISDSNSYKIGDCVTILLDNGAKVYTIKKN